MKIRTANAFRTHGPNGDNLLGVVIHLFFFWFYDLFDFLLLSVMFT